MMKNRLPPGQRLATNFPVLHFGAVPRFEPDNWDFKLFGAVPRPSVFSWREFGDLPQSERTADFHCVTGWTRLDCHWGGILFKDLVALVGPSTAAKHVLIHADPGYTTNLPLADMLEDDVILALRLDKTPLPAIHGGPLRLIVPKKYAYKSAKWLRAIEFLEKEKLGYWESRGYSNTADPWTEDRYS